MTATISMTVANGLGQPQSSLSNYQIIEFQKVICSALCFQMADLYIAIQPRLTKT
jgi:hypothetical protein